MNLIRKHKISLINNVPLSGRDKEIIDFIEDKLTGLVRFEHKKYPKSVFYMKDGELILEHGLNFDTDIGFGYGFMNVLGGKYGKYDMNYNDIREIIKYMVEYFLKRKVTSIGVAHDEDQYILEQFYKFNK